MATSTVTDAIQPISVQPRLQLHAVKINDVYSKNWQKRGPSTAETFGATVSTLHVEDN